MRGTIRLPDGWSTGHSKAFLLLCAAGVDGFHRDELGSIVPILERFGISRADATIMASEAFSYYKAHAAADSVEDAMVLHALKLKRNATGDELSDVLGTLHEIARIDADVSEGERLVLTLLEELWAADA